MRFYPLATIRMTIIVTVLSTGLPICSAAQEKAHSGVKVSGLQQRIDFGSAYILGQSIKSGAVYLLHRKKSEIKGMLEVRQNYRHEIMEEFALEKTAIVNQDGENFSAKTKRESEAAR